VGNHQRAVPTVKNTRWFLKNQRFWFYVECNEKSVDYATCLHAVCMSTDDGMFFVDHDYVSLDIVKVEADLQNLSELWGCHKFAALWSDDTRVKVRECVIQGEGYGPARIFAGFGGAMSPMTFWTTKQTAFVFATWLRSTQSSARVRWE
jgi:hypothetical protein